jgi:putative chitinase
MSILQPTNRSEIVVDDFIQYATNHLTTISGVVNTLSLYPPIGTPSPGVVLWSGYTVPPAAITIIAPELDTTPIEMSDDQLALSILGTIEGLPIYEATALAFETDVSQNPPTANLQQAQLILEQSMTPSPLPPEGDNQPNPETSPNNNQDEEVPNYASNISVPNDIILAMRRWGVGKDNPLERAHFLAQCSVESGGFKAKTENLSYSAKGLLKTFSKYFKTEADANAYAKQPEKIASRVYGSRMGNGAESTKEGYKYRGRGYIQLTGKANYVKAETVIKGNIVNNPDSVATTYPGDSACFFWTANKLKNLINQKNNTSSVEIISTRINGGNPAHGLASRKEKFTTYWKELQRDPKLWS